MFDLNSARACDHLIQDEKLSLSPLSWAWFTKSIPNLDSRLWGCSFVSGIKGLFGLGYDKDGNIRKDLWQYNMETDKWTEMAYYPGGERMGISYFTIGDKGYTGVGWNGTTYEVDFYEYDPYNDVWTAKTDFPGSGRMWGVGFNVNNKGYIGLGYDGSDYKQDFYEYDPSTNTWVSAPTFLGSARHSATAFVLNGNAYVGLGFNGSSYEKDFYKFNGVGWSSIADFSGTARINATPYIFQDKAYVGLGYDNTSTPQANFYVYDPGSGGWVYSHDFTGGARHGSYSFYSEYYDFVIIGFGYDGVEYKTDLYKLGPLQWEADLRIQNDNNILKVREWNDTENLTLFSWKRDGVSNFQLQSGAKNIIFNITDSLCYVDGTTMLYPQNTYLATYTTYQVNCPKCSGTGILHDIGFDSVGRLTIANQKDRVKQMLIKALLITKENNIYHPEYGSVLSALVGKKFTPYQIVRIQQGVQDTVNQLIVYQNEYISQLTLSEIIVSVDEIKLDIDENEPRLLKLLITVVLGDYSKVKTAFTLMV